MDYEKAELSNSPPMNAKLLETMFAMIEETARISGEKPQSAIVYHQHRIYDVFTLGVYTEAFQREHEFFVRTRAEEREELESFFAKLEAIVS